MMWLLCCVCCVEQRLAGRPLRGGRWRGGGGGQPQLRRGQQLHIQQGAPGRGRPTGEHHPVTGGNQQLPAAAAHRRSKVRRFDYADGSDDNDDEDDDENGGDDVDVSDVGDDGDDDVFDYCSGDNDSDDNSY